jgi:hypothetical protein
MRSNLVLGVVFLTSQIIGSNMLVLFLQHDELDDLGLCCGATEGREMKRLVVDTLSNLGYESNGDMKIEVFDGKQGILIFAETDLESLVRYMMFSDLEDLIDAVGAINARQIRSKLTYYMDCYWLELRGARDAIEKAALQLGEYGHHIDAFDYNEGVLEEYGTLIEERNAIGTIRSAFYSCRS